MRNDRAVLADDVERGVAGAHREPDRLIDLGHLREGDDRIAEHRRRCGRRSGGDGARGLPARRAAGRRPVDGGGRTTSLARRR